VRLKMNILVAGGAGYIGTHTCIVRYSACETYEKQTQMYIYPKYCIKIQILDKLIISHQEY